MADTIDVAGLVGNMSFADTDTPYPTFEGVADTEYSPPADESDGEDILQLAQTAGLVPTPSKHRGRPKGSKNRTTSKRDTSEVAKRLQGILEGATGIPAVWHEHIQMTDEEARSIAEPMSDWLVRQEGNSELIREFLDTYDIVAAAFAVLAYLVRVWRDEAEYRRTNSERRPADKSNVARVEEQQEQTGENPEQRTTDNGEPNPWISTPYIARD
jgi:hypothetical protein